MDIDHQKIVEMIEAVSEAKKSTKGNTATDKAKKVSPWIIAVTAIITLLGTYFFMTKEDGTKLEMRVEQQEKVVETQAESQRTMTQTMSRIQRTQDAMIVKDPELAPMLREMMEADSTR